MIQKMMIERSPVRSELFSPLGYYILYELRLDPRRFAKGTAVESAGIMVHTRCH